MPSVPLPHPQHGLIVADEEEYLIEPLQSGTKRGQGPEESGPHVVYKRSSLRHPHLDTACGVRGTSVCGAGKGAAQHLYRKTEVGSSVSYLEGRQAAM